MKRGPCSRTLTTNISTCDEDQFKNDQEGHGMDTDTSEDAGGPAILSGNEVMEAQFKVHDATEKGEPAIDPAGIIHEAA